MITRICKFLLALLSWTPLVWIAAMLTCTLLLVNGWLGSFWRPLEEFLIGYGYVRGHTLVILLAIWLLLLAVLTYRKSISVKRCVFYAVLMPLGVLCACLSLKYDLFGVSGYFVD